MERRPTTCANKWLQNEPFYLRKGYNVQGLDARKLRWEKACNFRALPFEGYRKRRNNRVIGFFLSKLFVEYTDITIVIDHEVNPNTEYLIFYFLLCSLKTIFPIHFASLPSKFLVQACIRDNAKNMELTSNRQLTRCHSHADVRKRIQLMKCRSNGR